MRRNVIFLVASLVIVLGALLATVVSGNTPVLGLDLRGGVSVVLSPVGNYKPAALDVAVDIIRNRVDSLGVAEPEISRQGNDIVVDLPGVKDRCKAERLVGQTAELRFRSGADRGDPAREDADHDHHHGRARRVDHHLHEHDHDRPPRLLRPPRPLPPRPRPRLRVRRGRREHREDVEGRGGQRRDRVLRPERGRRAAEDPHDVT